MIEEVFTSVNHIDTESVVGSLHISFDVGVGSIDRNSKFVMWGLDLLN